MATRIYGVNPGKPFEINSVIEAVGPTATSAIIAVVVDLTATTVTGAGGVARGPNKSEVLAALDTAKAYITAKNWPPA